MIHIYFRPSSRPTFIQTKKYFEKNKIEYISKSHNNLSIEEIKTFLRMSPNLEFLLNREIIKKLDWNIKFNNLLIEIKENPMMLKSPIVINYKYKTIITGFSEDKLDMFLRFKNEELLNNAEFLI